MHSWNRARAGIAAGVMGAVVWCGGAHAQADAPIALQEVSASGDTVRVEFSRPLDALPAGFSIQSPARIALDLPGVVNGLGRTQVELDHGNVRSARVVEAENRTRLVLNLGVAAAWKSRLEGSALLLTLDTPAGARPAPPAAATLPERAARGVLPLKDLDFRRASDGAGRVIVELPNAQVPADIRQEGGKIVVDFLRSALPEGFRRRMDVTDFGTPVQTVTLLPAGDRVRMVIEAQGDWEHSAYQSDTRFVVELRRPRENPDKLTAGPGYGGEKLSLNFQNIEVRSLLQVIADFTKFNIVTSDSVSGAVTLRLQEVPWDQALEIVLQARNLGMRKSGNVLWVAPKDEIAAKEKLDLEARAAIQTLEPLRTQSFAMNYAKAAEVATQLTGSGSSRVLSARGSAMAEPRTNQLFVTDIPSRLEAVQQLIAKIDIPVKQVLIEARIVEASDSFGKSLGVKLGVNATPGKRVAVGNTYDAVSAATGQTDADSSTTQMVNLPASGQGGSNPATIALSFFNSSATRFLNLELSAMEADSKGKVVSSPRVVTANQTKATIEQGTEFPYQQATSSGATSVSFRKATLKLEVTPQITPDGNVMLDLQINKDSRGETTAAGVAIDTRQVQTKALVENGGTVVIGGIFEMTESNSESRVPLLGELPVLGALFRSRTTSRDRKEVLVFITPRILADPRSGR